MGEVGKFLDCWDCLLLLFVREIYKKFSTGGFCIYVKVRVLASHLLTTPKCDTSNIFLFRPKACALKKRHIGQQNNQEINPHIF